MKTRLMLSFWLLAAVAVCPPAQGALRTLSGHVPDVVTRLAPVGRMATTAQLNLAISLPLRNQANLDLFLRDLYDPASPDFHRYLTPEQFTARFGPTEDDYQAVQDFARTNGLAIRHLHGNRVLVDVSGSVADIERAFHVSLRTYRHPTEARTFFAPDVEPSITPGVPVLDVSGLSDYARPQPAMHHLSAMASAQSAAGSAPGGYLLGLDFRRAYVPGTTLDGTGQSVGLIEFTGYDPLDITNYETLAGLPAVSLQNVLLDGATGAPGEYEDEVCLDIEMAIAMATNLSQVVVFEAPSAMYWNDVLNSMAASNQIKQFSSSWGYSGSPSAGSDQIFQQMAAQGQSFFQASGDGDAWTSPIWQPAESPYLTVVGGTTLAMNGNGDSYYFESVWNAGYTGKDWQLNGSGYNGSGGGVSGNYAIPIWQTNISTTANQASASRRNIPDVAMAANFIYITHGSGTNAHVAGTSCAAPLWAGYMALANQQAASLGRPSAGFINPAIYALAASSNYSACFHDIVLGNNFWSGSPASYSATSGYDLCTGLGTPSGTDLITALVIPPAATNQLVLNGGFETSSFTGWLLFGNTTTEGRSGVFYWNAVITPAAHDHFDVAHSGNYGAFLGDSQVAILMQNLPTTPGQKYLLSFWLNNPISGNGQIFMVNWNTNGTATNTIYYQPASPVQHWTNFNFVVTATGTNTALQFGAENLPNYFGLDDVSVVPIPPPAFSAVQPAGANFTFTWSTLPHAGYRVQYQTNLLSGNWLPLGAAITAVSNSASLVDTNGFPSAPQKFYRVTVWP